MGNTKIPTTDEMREMQVGMNPSIAAFSNFDAVGHAEIENFHVAKNSANEAYYGNPEEKKKDETAEIIRDEAMDELQEQREKRMEKIEKIRFSNGFEFTLEEFEEANDNLIEEIEQNIDKYAAENDLSLAEAALMIEMGKYAKKNGFDENQMKAQFGEENVEKYQKTIQKTIEHGREQEAIFENKASTEVVSIEETNDLLSDFAVNDTPDTQNLSDDLLAEFSVDSEITADFNQMANLENNDIENSLGVPTVQNEGADNTLSSFTV